MTSLPRGSAAPGHGHVRRRRAVAAVGAVSAGLLVLAACDKPTPMATVTVGKTTKSTEAECYEDGKAISRDEATKCTQKKAENTIRVPQGETLRIGVDPDIADEGWSLWIDGQQVIAPLKKSYYSFQGVDLFAPQQGQQAPKELRVSVVQQSGDAIQGVWNFKLENDDA
ncbi:hypothetical protein [Streptomyces sp. NBC_00286]|uniref:hypothetical protein n=1 Tax=Streptomyces sp. NBC_00286 TaxID=2975701 RepID=UPI002E2D619F|nr:hypothetical protein [Streptomyces sp. NBC_00286]